MPTTNEQRELRLQSPYMRGDDVTFVQTRLEAAGFSPGKIDGIFGKDTQSAVTAFQKAKGLQATGTVGEETYRALTEAAAPGGTPLEAYIAYLEEQVDNHSIYVWGAQGQGSETITEAWIRRKETSSANADRAISFWKKQVNAGYGDVLRAYDCSGLGMYWLQNQKGIAKGDMSSNTMMNKCAKLKRDELRRGDWVFRVYNSGSSKGRAYHIGYIVDDALNVIEAKGRDDGVVRRKLDASGASYWNAYGRPSSFFPEGLGGGGGASPSQGAADFAVCTGGTVNLRSGPSTAYSVTGIVSKGDKLLAMPEEGGWRRVCAAIDGALTLGYMSASYVQQA